MQYEGPKMGAVRPSSQCQVGVGVGGGATPWRVSGTSPKTFKALGLHFGQFLANLALCVSSFKKSICCLKR